MVSCDPLRVPRTDFGPLDHRVTPVQRIAAWQLVQTALWLLLEGASIAPRT